MSRLRKAFLSYGVISSLNHSAAQSDDDNATNEGRGCSHLHFPTHLIHFQHPRVGPLIRFPLLASHFVSQFGSASHTTCSLSTRF